MGVLRNARRLLALLAAAAILSSCGGDGPSTAGASTPSAPSKVSPPTAWLKGQFAPETTFAALCVEPRSGTDPGTNKPYPDVQGTLLDELNWLRSWTNDLYLWFDEVLDRIPPPSRAMRPTLQH